MRSSSASGGAVTKLAAPVGAGAEVAEHAPGFERQAVARQVGDAIELVERAVERAAAVLGGDQEVHHALDRGGVVAVARRHGLHLVAHGQRFEAGARGSLHVRWRVVAAQRLQRAAQDAHDPVGALGVAAEPEQVVGDAALDDALRALHARGLDGRLPQAAVRRHLAVGDDPHVAGARFRRAQGHGEIGHDGHGEAAGHDGEAVGGGGDEEANGERLRHAGPCGVNAGVVPKPMRSSATSISPCSSISSLQRAALRLGEAGAELAVLRAARAARCPPAPDG